MWDTYTFRMEPEAAVTRIIEWKAQGAMERRNRKGFENNCSSGVKTGLIGPKNWIPGALKSSEAPFGA